MSSEVFNLAILLTLKDAASGGLDRVEARMRKAGAAGRKLADEFKSLREELNKSLAIGGIGVAGLGMLYKGVKAAGDFQAVMSDLSSSLAVVGSNGKVNFNALAMDMQKAEAVAVKLGNALPGTTADFALEIQALKQNGLATETIMNGAAEAVAKLAVASNAIPKDIAADFAQFGNLFKLKAEDFAPAADVFSKIYTSTGQTSAELVEAAKYFQGRAGTALGIGGLKDAEKMTRLFGMMGMKGMRGSSAGTALTDFFSEYSKHSDRVEKLKKDTGIKLDFFDAKGNFAGMDAVFEQMQQFNKLTNKEKIDWNEWIFGLRGMSAANIFIDEGISGWNKYNQAQDKTISLTDKVTAKSATFNNQMEALEGTLENLGITVFEPMLPGLTSVIGGTNELVASIQEFTKAHPDLAKWAVELAAYGTSAMVVYSGFKAMTTGVKMFQLANQFSNSGGLLSYLNGASQSAGAATTRVAGFTRQLGAAETQATGLGGTLRKLAGSSILKVGVDIAAIAVAEAAITAFAQMVAEQNERTAQFLETAKEIRGQYDRMAGLNLLYNKPGDYGGQKGEFDSQAASILKEISEGGVLKGALHPEQKSWWQYAAMPNPYLNSVERTGKTTSFDPQTAAQYWRNKGVTNEMQDPNVLARLVDAIQKGGGDANFNGADIKLLIEALEKVTSKEKMQTANDILRKERGGSDNPQSGNQQKPLAFLNQPSLFPKIQPSPLPNFFQPPQSKGITGTQPLIKGFSENTLTGGKSTPTALSPIMKGFDGAMVSIVNSGTKVSDSFLALQQTFSPQNTNFFTQFGENVGNLQQPLVTTSQNVGSLGDSAGKAFPFLNSVGVAANTASGGLNSLGDKLANWTPPTPNVQTITIAVPPGTTGAPSIVGIAPPSKAVGGTVLRDGLVYVHAGEDIMPADVTKQYRQPSNFISQLTQQRFFDKRNNQDFQNSVSSNNSVSSLQDIGNLRENLNASTHSPAFNRFAANDSLSQFQNSNQVSNSFQNKSANESSFSLFRNENQTSSEQFSNTENNSQPLLKQAEIARQILTKSSSQNTTINAPLTLTINGNVSKADKNEFAQKLNEHAKHISRLVADNMENRRYRE